jgi:hypothetical protein
MNHEINRNVLCSAATADGVDNHTALDNDPASAPFRKKAMAIAAATLLSA